MYQIKVSDKNGERVKNLLPLSPPYPINKIELPMEQKLVADYVNKLKYGDIIKFCDSHDIDYVKGEDFPRDRIRKARQNLIKMIGEDKIIVLHPILMTCMLFLTRWWIS